jgi:protein-S-isoprenylcysteine O-methyltransferase Ste14
MRRWSFFAYGVFCHLLFLATYAYMAGFFGNFLVPKSLDSAPDDGLAAVGFNMLLIGLFGLQHSIMARPWFKRIWTRLVPQPIERSTYCLMSCVVLLLLMWQWRGLDPVIWNVESPVRRGLLWGLFAAGWFLVPAVSLMINHFDLFGTRQVWLYLRGRPYTSLPFRTPLLYSRIRHPLYVGWALAFWATPTMTLGHLLLACALSLYMGIAVLFEERDLVDHFGDVYRAYQRRVPRFIPGLPFRHACQFLHPAGRELQPILSGGSACDRPAPVADVGSQQPGQGVTHVSAAPTS